MPLYSHNPNKLNDREAIRRDIEQLGSQLEARGVQLRPLVRSEPQQEGSSATLRLAARCYDDAFWALEELRIAQACILAEKGLGLLS